MKCKSCGGELLFRDGIYLCKSCGETSTLGSIYENIDVCICYEENDATGRRTRDSIIAQEVYRKLEESNVATFYQRISADGITGNDLEAGKLAAIHRAKVVIVLGTSVDNFSAIETKYGDFFVGKVVIPFCVDINPNTISKTLSKIQAISYSTIGWEKDLIKGIYNILGRSQTVDTGSLYHRRKSKTAIVSIVAAVLVVVGVVAALFFKKPNVDSNGTEEAIESTEKPLTQKEIYDNATELLNQGSLVEALELFWQIPNHANSANMIKQIYSKYEGYYQNQTTTIYLNITDNSCANVEMRIMSDVGITTITVIAQIDGANISCTYVDNLKNAGNLELKLENTGLSVIQQLDGAEKVELFYALAEKTDQPVAQIDVDMLLAWLDQPTTYKQVKSHGYSFDNESIDVWEGVRYCRIKDTDIYLTFLTENYGDEVSDEDFFLYTINAPAMLIAPFLVGKADAPFWRDSRSYWPQYENEFYGNVDGIGNKIVTETTPVRVFAKETYDWNHVVERVLLSKAECLLREKYQLNEDSLLYSVHSTTVGENDTYYLFSLQTDSMRKSDTCIWYKANKSGQTVVFVREGPYYEALIEVGQFGEEGYFAGFKIDKNLWFSEYADFAEEFPGVF